MTRQQHRREEQETVKTKKITDRVEERIRQVNEREREGIVYLRVSSEAQDGDDKVSLAEQLADIEQYAKQNNIRINRVFQDVAPGSSKNRADFQRMLSEIRNGKVHVLLCWKADRLARGVHPASALLEALEGTDVELAAIHGTIDRNYFALMALFGGIELENLMERSRMGKRGRARNGKIPSRNICYGYIVDEDGFPQIDEAASETIRYIYHLSNEKGYGTRKIADILNTEGTSSPQNGKKGWSQSTVLEILSNATYTGIWHYGQSRHVKSERGRRVRSQPEDQWIEVEVPQIIDQNTWDMAQQLKEQRRTNAKRNTKVFYLLQHQIYCESCGRMMGCMTTKFATSKKKGKTYRYELNPPKRYYCCYGSIFDKSECREQKYIRAEKLEDLIWQETVRIIRDPQIVISGLESHNIDFDKKNLLSQRIAKAEQAIEEEEDARRKLIYQNGRGLITEEELEDVLPVIRARLQHYTNTLNDLREQEKMGKLEEEHKRNFEALTSAIGHRLNEIDDEQRKEVLENLFVRITIDDKNRLTLTIALPEKLSVAIDTDAP